MMDMPLYGVVTWRPGVLTKLGGEGATGAPEVAEAVAFAVEDAGEGDSVAACACTLARHWRLTRRIAVKQVFMACCFFVGVGLVWGLGFYSVRHSYTGCGGELSS